MEYTGKNTLFDYLYDNDVPDGQHTLKLANGVVISIEMINYLDDKVFSSTEKLGSSVKDSGMLVIKCHKNCTIKEDVIVTPQVRRKGFLLIVKGNLMNKGTISMTARGAYASGEDVLLYGDEGKYDYVPAVGGSGGMKVGNINGKLNGLNGSNGSNRSTAGGGGGGYYSNHTGSSAGAGTAGTSYSGGSGGGGCASFDDTKIAGDGTPYGGPGGNANCRRTTANSHTASGGAGNDAGKSALATGAAGPANYFPVQSQSGTGGLLIIFCNGLSNNGVIESKGSDTSLTGDRDDLCCPGGASGGGSINIYAGIIGIKGNITAAGGQSAVGGRVLGGNGGEGSVTISQLITVSANSFVSESDLLNILQEITNDLMLKINNKSTEDEGTEEQFLPLKIKKYENEVETYDNLIALDFTTLENNTIYVAETKDTKCFYMFNNKCNGTDILPILIGTNVDLIKGVPSKTEYDELKKDHDVLKSGYDEFKTEYGELKKDYEDFKQNLKFEVVDGKSYIVTPLNDAGIQASVDESFKDLGQKVAMLAKIGSSGSGSDNPDAPKLEVNGSEEITVRYGEPILEKDVVRLVNVEKEITYRNNPEEYLSSYIKTSCQFARISSDGNVLLIITSSATNGGYVHVYRKNHIDRTYAYKLTIPSSNAVYDAAIADNGRYIVFTNGPYAVVYSYDLNETVTKMNMQIRGTNACISIDIYRYRYIVITNVSTPYTLYEVDFENDTATVVDGMPTISASYSSDNGAKYTARTLFTYDGKYIISQYHGTKAVFFISIENKSVFKLDTISISPYGMAISPVNRDILIYIARTIYFIRVDFRNKSIKVLQQINTDNVISSVTFSHDGKYVFIIGSQFMYAYLVNGDTLTQIEFDVPVIGASARCLEANAGLLIGMATSTPFIYTFDVLEPDLYAYVQYNTSCFGKIEGLAIAKETGVINEHHKVLKILQSD